ncbi:MAG: 4-hydroxy-3-methylbut-2-enyl diphosphate reductase [Candidatus Moranbacteria bacterium]|nr:4-hydroxy-3-methylbut-2-enyl diphosphate reductase [Candidatus Moranbacteria bacterium]
MNVSKIILAKPRGFCAGVARAVKVVEDCLEIFGAPVYVKHEIVHNKTVVADLSARGAVTVEDVRDIPEGAVVVFSAHGSPPEHYDIAGKKGATLIDATCPLVTKVHIEVHRYLKDGYKIVYIGHKGHVEGVGVLGEAKKYGVEIPLIESVSDAQSLPFSSQDKLAFLTQTTLSVSETKEIITALREKYPQIVSPSAQDICYATTNRQKAVSLLAKNCDIVLVLGSVTSSNSTRLAETARAQGCEAHLIDNALAIDDEWFSDAVHTVGVTAGASAPERVVQEVVEHFTQNGAQVEELEAVSEKMHFIEPLELSKIKKDRGK